MEKGLNIKRSKSKIGYILSKKGVALCDVDISDDPGQKLAISLVKMGKHLCNLAPGGQKSKQNVDCKYSAHSALSIYIYTNLHVTEA